MLAYPVVLQPDDDGTLLVTFPASPRPRLSIRRGSTHSEWVGF